MASDAHYCSAPEFRSRIDQKENMSNRRAERKSSEIFGFGCVEHKLHKKKKHTHTHKKQTDRHDNKILPDSTKRGN